MVTGSKSLRWERLRRLRRQRRTQNLATWAVVVLGPILALATYLALGPFGQTASSAGLRLILLADVCYVLTLGALVAWRVGTLLVRRRERASGTRLHLRLAAVFAAVALMPTILVAVFATTTLGIGLENLYSDRIGSVSQSNAGPSTRCPSPSRTRSPRSCMPRSSSAGKRREIFQGHTGFDKGPLCRACDHAWTRAG